MKFWRTLDELNGDAAFDAQLVNEFPSQVEAITDPVARRTFLKLMGASMGLAGITACTRQPAEHIVPYVRQPEEIVPGRPLFYATALTLGGVATGVLVESHEGRPTKIEGNPEHPDSGGATDALTQAAILELYDPDRARAITNQGEIRTWESFLAALQSALRSQEALQGAGLRILTESVSSPTLAARIRAVLAAYPSARWHQWDPASHNSARVGAQIAFGAYVGVQYRVAQADVVVSLDSDFLTIGGGSLRYARELAERRRPGATGGMNRLYAIESMPMPTGTIADHRLPLRPSEIEEVARYLAGAVGVAGVSATVSDEVRQWSDVVARDLLAHRGASLIVAGDSLPPALHALTHAMNAALGNVGQTVVYTDPVEIEPIDQHQSLADLAADMHAGRVDLLVIAGGNPAFTAPADIDFPGGLDRVPIRIHLSATRDETSERAHWHIPEAHFLEAWGDARAFDGTVSIVQPLIAPLYGGRTPLELMTALAGGTETPYDQVRAYWRAATAPPAPAGDTPDFEVPLAGEDRPAEAVFETSWRQWLHDGVVPNTAFAPREVVLQPAASAAGAAAPSGSGIEVSFRHDSALLDGRFANNAWLQELPRSITKLTWGNAVLMSPSMAERLGVSIRPAMRGGEHGQVVTDVVDVRVGERSVRGPAFPVAGHPDNCVTLQLGYGRQRAGSVGTGVGFDVNTLRTMAAPWSTAGAEVVLTGDRESLACTQYHHLMEGRGMVRSVSLEAFSEDPHVVHEGHHVPPRTLTLHPEHPYDGYKWGMAIDVNVCTGCNACVVGCQAENNVPVVGRDQVLRGREMHWLRVDSYQRGPAENPERYSQPVPCMQCENAPCEIVCPVNATVHSSEGLNDMVYNRCVGTRYCSNNCPYKVRRFNYHLYQDWETPSLQLMRNPDVTVRSRGVMEKCTYCVQRINAVRIESEKDNRRIRDGEIQTACQAVCPTDAIVFGDLNDPNSRVTQLQAEERNYSLLAELNTRPRTTYMAAVRNLNPELEG
ncbi:MAG: TAT-variant-translocated molybdopterin oxidoreductase [Vicinamibacterales bacterium]